MSTHTRFDEGHQEWQLIDNETHEVLAVAETAAGLRSDAQLADEGIYFLGHLSDLREQCEELDSISFNESDWDGPGHYQFDFENGTVSPVEVGDE